MGDHQCHSQFPFPELWTHRMAKTPKIPFPLPISHYHKPHSATKIWHFFYFLLHLFLPHINSKAQCEDEAEIKGDGSEWQLLEQPLGAAAQHQVLVALMKWHWAHQGHPGQATKPAIIKAKIRNIENFQLWEGRKKKKIIHVSPSKCVFCIKGFGGWVWSLPPQWTWGKFTEDKWGAEAVSDEL